MQQRSIGQSLSLLNRSYSRVVGRPRGDQVACGILEALKVCPRWWPDALRADSTISPLSGDASSTHGALSQRPRFTLSKALTTYELGGL